VVGNRAAYGAVCSLALQRLLHQQYSGCYTSSGNIRRGQSCERDLVCRDNKLLQTADRNGYEGFAGDLACSALQ
jgi:hypothetical protein